MNYEMLPRNFVAMVLYLMGFVSIFIPPLSLLGTFLAVNGFSILMKHDYELTPKQHWIIGLVLDLPILCLIASIILFSLVMSYYPEWWQ